MLFNEFKESFLEILLNLFYIRKATSVKKIRRRILKIFIESHIIFFKVTIYLSETGIPLARLELMHCIVLLLKIKHLSTMVTI